MQIINGLRDKRSAKQTPIKETKPLFFNQPNTVFNMTKYTIDGYATREAFIASLKLSRSTFYRWISQTNIELPAGLLSATDQQQIMVAFETRPRKQRKNNTLAPNQSA
jgi:hypothetical protein